MSVVEYENSWLPYTPLGQSAVMEEALMIARRMAPAAQGRMILCASVAAARALGAPLHDADLASMRCANYYYADSSDEVYRPDRHDDGRNVRPRYQ
jgi:hypothetical protein